MDEIYHMPYVTITKKQYFWPWIKRDIVDYIARCQKCHQVKAEHQHLVGLLQSFPILEWEWEEISMDFITGLPMRVKQHDSIMVVVDKLTKETFFILVNSTHKTYDIAEIFMKEIF